MGSLEIVQRFPELQKVLFCRTDITSVLQHYEMGALLPVGSIAQLGLMSRYAVAFLLV